MATFPVTFTYKKPGTEPPVFIAGTFAGLNGTTSNWEPIEMICTKDEDGEYLFARFMLLWQDSVVQYKFRLGDGDWWVLDEDADTTTDTEGNVNNTLRASRPHSVRVSEHEPLGPAAPILSHEIPNGRHEDSGSLTNGTNGNFPREMRPSGPRQSAPEGQTVVNGSPVSPVVSSGLSAPATNGLPPYPSQVSLESFEFSPVEDLDQHPNGEIQNGVNGVSGRYSAPGPGESDGNVSLTLVLKVGPTESTLEASSDEDEGISVTTGSKKDAENTGTGIVRKRNTTNAEDRPTSSTSMPSTHEAGENENWLHEFLRVVFVEWIGGFLTKAVWGNRRKA
ncbi:hypothetical protein BJ170DRAFT_682616 [Xylariales sp. AK1849]|nr:hypothetical protein BJ170DRAFT_682616 [Xylariales sp. AK1849]